MAPRTGATAVAVVAVAISLIAAHAPLVSAGVAGDVTLSLDADRTLGGSMGNIDLILNGGFTIFIGMAAALPVPPTVDQAFLRWKSPSELNYTMTLTSGNTDVMPDPDLGIPLQGRLPNTFQDLVVTHTCIRDGVVSVTLVIDLYDYELPNQPHYGPIEVVYSKECDLGATVDAGLPTFCSPNDDPKAPTFVGGVKFATFNVHGFADASVTEDSGNNIPDQAAALLSHIQAADVQVLAIQEVWTSELRDLLATGLGDIGFEQVVEELRGAQVQGSGMMFATKLPVRRCNFDLFSDAEGTDQLTSKGVFSVLLDAGAGRSYYTFITDMQSGADRYEDTRASQRGTIMAKVESLVARFTPSSVSTQYDINEFGRGNLAKMGIVLMGTMNEFGNTYTEADGTYTIGEVGGTQYDLMVADLTPNTGEDPRDIMRELADSESDTLLTTLPFQLTCDSELSYDEISCEDGESIDFPGARVDYIFTWNRVNTKGLNVVAASDASVATAEDDSFDWLDIGGQPLPYLSDHGLVSVTLTHSDTSGGGGSGSGSGCADDSSCEGEEGDSAASVAASALAALSVAFVALTTL